MKLSVTMKRSLALVVANGALSQATTVSNFSSPAQVCRFFSSNFGNLTSLPNSTVYNDINTDFWDAAASLGPACIFAPDTAEKMGLAVKTLVQHNTPFALKGGGHLAIAGANNINSSGVLLAGVNLNQIDLATDNRTVDVGPGNNWGTVMAYLENYNLSVVGGRMSIVGVPGLLTGGGMSNFGNEYGWASSNIDEYTCVLADGTLANVTAANEYSDLFWALRGGGNSFCIVTNFKLRTIDVPYFTAGQRSWAGNQSQGFLDAVYNMAVNSNPDVKGALIPVSNAGSSQNGTTHACMMFYNGNDTTPDFYQNLSAPILTPLTDTYGPMDGMGSAATFMAAGTDQIAGFREGWWFLTIRANREALQIIHDTYFEMIAAHFADVDIWITGLAMNIVSKQYVLGGNEQGGPDPMGLDPSLAPYIMVEESITWYEASDDATVDAFYEAFNKNITAQLEPLGVLSPYVYLNDANGAQDVFGGYPAENVERLKAIREKYDPSRVYTDLMPGGWKVADYEV